MIINLCFSTFCNLLTKSLRQTSVDIIRPKTHSLSPLLYCTFLLRSVLALSFIVAEC